ncbi:MAG: hypothetical protein U0797_24595 [Gemmataceae bacterium]
MTRGAPGRSFTSSTARSAWPSRGALGRAVTEPEAEPAGAAGPDAVPGARLQPPRDAAGAGRRRGWRPPSLPWSALAAGALDDLLPSGATDHVAALRRGLVLRPDLLFLLTDAAALTDKDVLAVTTANRGTAIHVVELTGDPASGNGPLARLATANGGTHRRVRPSSDAPEERR